MSKERLPFSIAYFGSLALTLYFSLGVCIPEPDLPLFALTFLLLLSHSHFKCYSAEVHNWDTHSGHCSSKFMTFLSA
ncbi:MAG: hypothetical protein DI631_12350 [Acinetobacter johnsonii]|nr:MAG: hypothetical protein DI631_12350 [Acinetobacter johnsonii]